MSLLEHLRALEQPIRVGIVGVGQMGTGLLCQMERIPGMEVVATADISNGRAMAGYRAAGVSAGIIRICDDPVDAGIHIESGGRIATTNPDVITAISAIEVVVEATGIPEVGARTSLNAILARKHVVNLNAEADVTVGGILSHMAEAAGVVYTLTAGDEPGAIKELFDFATTVGFDVVTLGKGKNNPLHRHATPQTVHKKATTQDMNPKMLASFVDGTKTMVELAAVANGTGFRPEVRGCHGPHANVVDLTRVFVPRSDGGILDKPGAVEYAIGDVAPGVFLIFTTDQPKMAQELRYLHIMGHGAYWALYRPYHLASLETPISIARAALRQEATLVCSGPPCAEVIAAAKRPLKAGERIDGIGGYHVYGLVEQAEIAHSEGFVPIGLVTGATVVRHVPQDAIITTSDVELDASQLIVSLRQLQDDRSQRKSTVEIS